MRTKHRNGNHYDLYHDVAKVKAALMDTANGMRDKATDFLYESVDDVKDKTTEVKDNLAKYTAKKPFKSLGIAMLVGMGIGYILRK